MTAIFLLATALIKDVESHRGPDVCLARSATRREASRGNVPASSDSTREVVMTSQNNIGKEAAGQALSTLTDSAKALFDSARVMMHMIDTAGRLHRVNRLWSQTLGYPRKTGGWALGAGVSHSGLKEERGRRNHAAVLQGWSCSERRLPIRSGGWPDPRCPPRCRPRHGPPAERG